MATTKHTYDINIKRLPQTDLKIKNFDKISILPKSVDLRSKMPPVFNQGNLSCCTGFAISACFDYEDKSDFQPSPLFIYYNERLMGGSVMIDSGANIADGIRSLETFGVCKNSSWPYIINKFKTKPPETCYKEALNYKVTSSFNVQQDITSIKTCLANGHTIVLGIAIYSSFESRECMLTGKIPIPNPNDEYLGGHCVVCVGYDDETQTWLMRNSRGTGWGNKGYFTLPYSYLLDNNLCSDLWAITSVKITPTPTSKPTPVSKRIPNTTSKKI
jgi:C1A family cysteine protease